MNREAMIAAIEAGFDARGDASRGSPQPDLETAVAEALALLNSGEPKKPALPGGSIPG